MSFPVTCDAATTGEIRVEIIHAGGTEYTNTLSIAASANGRVEMQLDLSVLSGYPSGWAGAQGVVPELIISTQGRRVTGAANLNVYEPTRASFQSSEINGAGSPLASACTFV